MTSWTLSWFVFGCPTSQGFRTSSLRRRALVHVATAATCVHQGLVLFNLTQARGEPRLFLDFRLFSFSKQCLRPTQPLWPRLVFSFSNIVKCFILSQKSKPLAKNSSIATFSFENFVSDLNEVYFSTLANCDKKYFRDQEWDWNGDWWWRCWVMVIGAILPLNTRKWSYMV